MMKNDLLRGLPSGQSHAGVLLLVCRLFEAKTSEDGDLPIMDQASAVHVGPMRGGHIRIKPPGMGLLSLFLSSFTSFLG